MFVMLWQLYFLSKTLQADGLGVLNARNLLGGLSTSRVYLWMTDCIIVHVPISRQFQWRYQDASALIHYIVHRTHVIRSTNLKDDLVKLLNMTYETAFHPVARDLCPTMWRYMQNICTYMTWSYVYMFLWQCVNTVSHICPNISFWLRLELDGASRPKIVFSNKIRPHRL